MSVEDMMAAEAELAHNAKRAADWAERARTATGMLEARRADREAQSHTQNAERWQRKLDGLSR